MLYAVSIMPTTTPVPTMATVKGMVNDPKVRTAVSALIKARATALGVHIAVDAYVTPLFESMGPFEVRAEWQENGAKASRRGTPCVRKPSDMYLCAEGDPKVAAFDARSKPPTRPTGSTSRPATARRSWLIMRSPRRNGPSWMPPALTWGSTVGTCTVTPALPPCACSST